ncbi:glycosyl transferase family 1 [Candidatus Falkowbacteria bacterium]|nr:MAG: glycosyl transferase family 1 [Candidatus Falkowbacteria bacterium]
MNKIKKIAICHYRVGGTDGVSLEIEKRKHILEAHGCEVKLIAGPRSRGADYTIKELEWDNGVIPIIKENGFLHFKRKDLDANELKKKMNKVSYAIQDRLNFIQLKEKFDYVLIHNIFSFGGHIAASKAFTKWIKKFKIPTLATHHDFYWERKEFQMPRNSYLANYMAKYMPPKTKYIEHVVINTLAQRELKKRSDINSDVMGDVFDFNQPDWVKDKFNKNFLEQFDIKPRDFIVLQATRVIPRKAIELSIDFVKNLNQKIYWLRRKKLYNGKKLNKKSKVILLVAGYAEDEKRDYLYKLKTKAFDCQVHAKFISDHVRSSRAFKQGTKYFSLWDAYVHADLVTFPSVWEGWGNQFIETIFAKKPVVIYEYPVYKTDIKKEGYKVISLGNGSLKKDNDELYSISPKSMKKAVKQTIRWMTNKKLNNTLDKNFKIGKKYHDYKVLEKYLIKKINL